MSVKTTFQDLNEFGWSKAEVLTRAQALRANTLTGADDLELNGTLANEYKWFCHNQLVDTVTPVAKRDIKTSTVTHTHYYDNTGNPHSVTLTREDSWDREDASTVSITSPAHVLLKDTITVDSLKISTETTGPISSRKVHPETISYQVHVAAGESVEWQIVKTVTGSLTVWEQAYGPQGYVVTSGRRHGGHYYHAFDVDRLLDTPRGKLQLQSVSTSSDSEFTIKNQNGPSTKSTISITHIACHPAVAKSLSDYYTDFGVRLTLPSHISYAVAAKPKPSLAAGRALLQPPPPPPAPVPTKNAQIRYTGKAFMGPHSAILSLARQISIVLKSNGYNSTSNVDSNHHNATFAILLPHGRTAADAEALFKSVLADKDVKFIDGSATKVLEVHNDGFECLEDIDRYSSQWNHLRSGEINVHKHFALPLVKYTAKAGFSATRPLPDISKQMIHLLEHRGYADAKATIDSKTHSITVTLTLPHGKSATDVDQAFKSVVSVWEHGRFVKGHAVKLFAMLEDGFEETEDIERDSYDWITFRSGAPREPIPHHHITFKYEGKASFNDHSSLEHSPIVISRHLNTHGYTTATPSIDSKHHLATFTIFPPAGKTPLDTENAFIHALTLDSQAKHHHGKFLSGSASKQLGTSDDGLVTYEQIDKDSDDWVFFKAGSGPSSLSSSFTTVSHSINIKYHAKASFPSANSAPLSALALIISRTLTARGFNSTITSSVDARHSTASFAITLPGGKTARDAESAFKATLEKEGGVFLEGKCTKSYPGGEEVEEVVEVERGSDDWDTLVAC